MQRLSPRQLASIHRGDLTDYTVAARDGRVGRLSAATAAVADGTVVVEHRFARLAVSAEGSRPRRELRHRLVA